MRGDSSDAATRRATRDARATMGAADAPRYVSALPSRSTRGRRLATLLEDEDSADEAFWNQDALAEESGDDAYESEEEPEDVFEDDFDESESSESEGEVRVARERAKRTLKAPERRGKDARGAGGGKTGEGGEAAAVGDGRGDANARGARATTAAAAAGGDFEMRKSKRSTAQAILERSERMRAERASKPAQERQKVEHRTWTQEELLEEAKETEYWNLIDLERLLTLEAEMKKKAPTVSNAYEGPSLVYRSSAKVDEGATMIELARGAETPEPLRQNKPTPAHKDKCVITGLPAKYKDPVTGMPYATIEAFKKVRARYPPLPPKPKPAPEEPDAAAAAPIEPKIEVVIDVPMEPEAPLAQKTKAKSTKKRPGKPSASQLSTVAKKTLATAKKTLKQEPEDATMTVADDEALAG